MKILIKIEELFLGLLAFHLFLALDYGWWWFFVLLLAPDLGLLGYALNPRIGALTYNLAHHKGMAVGLYLAGTYFMLPWLQLVGLIVLGHSSLDRVFGYGLKYPDSFQHTHLGMIGRSASQ
jgi:hypothetical protein